MFMAFVVTSLLVQPVTTALSGEPPPVVFPQEEWVRISPDQAGLNVPRYEELLGTSAEMRSARQTIYHDAVRPSHLVLPVMP
jgi:hypothetical protein